MKCEEKKTFIRNYDHCEKNVIKRRQSSKTTGSKLRGKLTLRGCISTRSLALAERLCRKSLRKKRLVNSLSSSRFCSFTDNSLNQFFITELLVVATYNFTLYFCLPSYLIILLINKETFARNIEKTVK